MICSQFSKRDWLQLAFGVGVETVEASRAVGTLHLLGTCVFQDTRRENLLAKIALVQPPVKNNLVHALQLTQGKLFRQQIKSNGSIVQFSTQALQRILKNLLMVKSQRWQFIHRKPADVGGIIGGLHL